MLYARAILTFLICFGQVVAVALAAGYLPALWTIAKKKRYRMLGFWTVAWLFVVAAAAYGIPLAMHTWRSYLELAPGRFKPVPMFLGYGIGLMGACFFFPEPMRIARNRLRPDKEGREEDEGGKERRRKRRKKRRTHHYDV